MLRVRFDGSAIVDVLIARDWYESERVGLGAGFVDAVNAAVALLSAFPDSGSTVHGSVRRILVGRFPYVVYYQHDNSDVVVLACLHVAREPEYHVRRLGR